MDGHPLPHTVDVIGVAARESINRGAVGGIEDDNAANGRFAVVSRQQFIKGVARRPQITPARLAEIAEVISGAALGGRKVLATHPFLFQFFAANSEPLSTSTGPPKLQPRPRFGPKIAGPNRFWFFQNAACPVDAGAERPKCPAPEQTLLHSS